MRIFLKLGLYILMKKLLTTPEAVTNIGIVNSACDRYTTISHTARASL